MSRVRAAASNKLLFLPHALQQMMRPERMISLQEVRRVVVEREVVEDYPEDARGHSCLLLGYGEANRPIHVVCSPKDDYLAIITTYMPDEDEWSPDLRTRAEKCIHCQGEMHRATAPFHVDRQRCHLTLDAVPAWVCRQCGEAYFEEREVEAIQNLVRSVEQKARSLSLTE